VLNIESVSKVQTGRSYAQLFDPENLVTPYDVVMQ
jgi:hypothetical protein